MAELEAKTTPFVERPMYVIAVSKTIYEKEKEYHLQTADSNPDDETRRRSQEWLDKYG